MDINKEYQEIWHKESFNRQMAEIQGEVDRILSSEGKLNQIRRDTDYQGEPQAIRHLFGIIKQDPKNKGRLSEICKAEEELFAFLNGNDNAPAEEEIRRYWDGFLVAYLDEI